METCESELEPPPAVTDGPTDFDPDIRDIESAENFQKFMFELFEKNGILNDLRAYLRGHIVNILRSAQTGDVPLCQKNFTQRLELPSQALNMLVAEYLLKMEFSYSLSVFVSEIPLANMVLDFARTLLDSREQSEGLRFNQKDVWSILNYLGIKCDSAHVTNVVEMYKSDNVPLLQCLLKCMPMYTKEPNCINQENVSEDSLSSVGLESLEGKTKSSHKSFQDKCRHTEYCKSCRTRITKLKEGFRKNKRMLAKNVKDTNINSSNVENLMKNVSDMERSLIDEMFEQLKAVYETEVEMLKAEEDKKVKRSLATHSLQLQQRRNEMEESFKARELELEHNLQQKKKFLWGLARALRAQHAQVSRAQLAVRHETKRLSTKEDNLKIQLIEAEQGLRKRCEDMRKQISNELVLLEGHLESMKRERDNINRERSELEHLKNLCDANSKDIRIENLDENADLRPYDFFKNELNVLKKYLESTKLGPKCVTERSTLTDLHDVSSKISVVLNNEQDSERNYPRDEERGVRTPNLVINDLKKQKNVNFSQSNLDEIYRERSRDRSRSSASSEAGDAAVRESFERDRDRERDRETICRLRDENDRLKGLARQQREHIDEVWTQQPPRVEERRVHAASAAVPATPDLFYVHSVNPTPAPNTYGWRKGAGEELTMFTNVPPRIVLPGDNVPFIGVVRDRQSDNRRHLLGQWRALRRHMSPAGAGRPRASPAASPHRPPRPCSAGPSVSMAPATQQEAEQDKQPFVTVLQPIQFEATFQPGTFNNKEVDQRQRTAGKSDTRKMREKSPKSLLREAKEKLRNSITKERHSPSTKQRDKSPNAVLREAKLRLRKLEIEAEAVEKSYRDFRRRQCEMRGRGHSMANEEAVVTKDVGNLDKKRSASLNKLDCNETAATSNSFKDSIISTKTDLDTYIREYQSAFETHFVNRNTAAKKTKPIPETFSPQIPRKTNDDLKARFENFLETPLTEFRKFYQSEKPQRPLRIDDASKDPPNNLPMNTERENAVENNEQEYRCDAVTSDNTESVFELEILKQNINKMYNIQEQPEITPEIPAGNIPPETDSTIVPENEKNLLRIEVENVSEINEILTESEPQNVLLLIESSVNGNEIESDENEDKIMSANMTILISPKRSIPDVERAKSPEKGRRSDSPEQAARLTRNDVLDAIFHNDMMKEASSIEMQLDISKDKEDSITEVEKPPDEYPDDFSADVDNYNTRSEYENLSPISIPKNSEDETFWE